MEKYWISALARMRVCAMIVKRRKLIRKGNINVRKGPSLKSAVIGKITEPDGIPDAYPCLGKKKGWYKIRFDGKVGYVREDMVEWDGMCTF